MAKKNNNMELNENMREFNNLMRQVLDAVRRIEDVDESRIKMMKEQNKLAQKNLENVEKEKKSKEEIHEREKAEQKLNEQKTNFSNKQIKAQQELNNLHNKYLNILTKTANTQKDEEAVLKEYRKEYEKLNKIAKSTERGNTFKSKVAGALGIGEQYNSAKNGSLLFDTAVGVFTKAVSAFATAVNKGIDKNYSTTEANLNKVVASNSVGMGLSWSGGSFSFGGRSYQGYNQLSNAIKDQLKSEGLYNNISNSDVITQVATLTSSGGLNLADAITKGYQDTVIKYIVPYLDTTSDTFNYMEYLMPGISKNVAATALSAKAQLGENQYISKYSNQLVELMQPVSLLANENLYSAEYEEIAKTLEAQVAAGAMSASEAQKLANSAFSMYMDPYGTLTGGSVLGKMTTISAMQSGQINSPSAYVQGLMGNIPILLSAARGNSFEENVISKELLGDASMFRNINYTKMNTKGIKIDGYDEQLKLYQKQVGLADDMNTNQQKLTVSVENATSDIAKIKTILGEDLWNIAKYIVGALAVGIIGKGIGALSGLSNAASLSSAGGLGAVLGKTGPIALAISSAAAGIGLAISKNNKEINDDAKNALATATNAESTYQAQGYSSAVASIKAVADSSQQHEVRDITQDFGLTSEIAKELGIEKKMFKGSGEEVSDAYNKFYQTQDWSAYNRLKFRQWMLNSKGEIVPKLIALLTAINLHDLQDDPAIMNALNYGMGTTGLKADTESIKAMIDDYTQGEGGYASLIYSSYNDLKADDIYPVSSAGKFFSYDDISQSELKERFNLHRYGLNAVPYDNYPAMLHEGEAVLTSSTANELRNLLAEYRNNKSYTAVIDASINNQTVELVGKLDEVIAVLSSMNVGGNGVSIPSVDMAKGRMRVLTSMAHLTNTQEALS